MAAQLGVGKRLPSPTERIEVWLIGGFLLFIGVALIAFQTYSIINNEEVTEALDPSYIGVGATIEKIEPANPDNANPQVVLLLEDGVLTEAGLATGDVIQSVNGETFDIASIEDTARQNIILAERERLVAEAIERDNALSLLADVRSAFNNNELVEVATIDELATLLDGYPDADALILEIRSYTATDDELAQMAALVEADVEASVPSIDAVEADFIVEADALDSAIQDVLAETLVNILVAASADGQTTVDLIAIRDGEEIVIAVPTPQNSQFELSIPTDFDAGTLGVSMRVARFPELVIRVDGGLADNIGLQNGDVLLSLNGDAITATQLMRENNLTLALSEQEIGEALQAPIRELLATAIENADGRPLTIEVLRDGDVQMFEFTVSADNANELGLIIFPAELPYFQIIPEEGGPASIDIDTGSALTQVDDTIISPSMETSVVQELVDDEGVSLNDEDFRIELSYKELNSDGGFEELTDRRVNKQVPPDLAVAFLYNFGLFVPIVTIILGIFIMITGFRLFSYDMVNARWANVVLLWLGVGIIVAAIRAFYVEGSGGSLRSTSGEPFDFEAAFGAILPLFIIWVPTMLALWRLGRLIDHVFDGEETLTSRNTRFAWSLLIPTLAALIIVAARPLEQTFIASLTDDRLASSQPARFVGLDNYSTLLSVTVDVVDCKQPTPEQLETERLGRTQANIINLLENLRINPSIADDVRDDASDRIEQIRGEENTLEADECLTTGDGGIDWELSDDLLAEGFREATVIDLPFSQQGLRILGKDAIFLKGIFNTLQFTIISVTLELVLGMIIALVVNTKFSGRGVMRTAMLVPWAIPTVVGATLWGVIMRDNQSGILNVLAIDLGLIEENEAWLSVSGPWLSAIIAIDVWKTSPFMALLLLAGLQTIPGDIYEAADVDGASKIRQFFSITIPLLRPTIAVALVFRTLDSLRVFDLFQVLLDPTTRPSMATHNYNQLIAQQQGGYASAIGVLIFLLILLFTVIYVRFVGIEQET